jgi:hypothetical protein
MQTNLITGLLQQFQTLSERPTWNEQYHQLVNVIDASFTKTLLQAEQESAVPCSIYWSSYLHIKHLIFIYWVTIIQGSKNKKNIMDQLKTLSEQIGESDEFQEDTTRSALKQLRHARKALLDSRLNSYQNRQVFLEHLQNQRIENGQATKAHIFHQIQKKERKKQCRRTFILLRNGPQTSGGISHVLVPQQNFPDSPSTYSRTQSKQLLDETLLTRNISHFQQAKDTPFTTPLLVDYIGEVGCHPNVDMILNGHVDINLPKIITLILRKFTSSSTPIPVTFTLEDMCKGFMKWRESTTTSPSGKHLGLY